MKPKKDNFQKIWDSWDFVMAMAFGVLCSLIGKPETIGICNKCAKYVYRKFKNDKPLWFITPEGVYHLDCFKRMTNHKLIEGCKNNRCNLNISKLCMDASKALEFGCYPNIGKNKKKWE